MTKAVVRCSVKKVFLKISQNSPENTCARVSFNNVAGLRPFFFSNLIQPTLGTEVKKKKKKKRLN